MPDVVIYIESWCGDCTRAKALPARKGESFTEFEISGDDALRDEMIARAGGRRAVPQVFIGETHVDGCDDLHELERGGRLDTLLARAGRIPHPSGRTAGRRPVPPGVQVPGPAPVRAGSVTPRRRFQSW